MDLKYTESEVLAASTEYFGGDELAAKIFKDKYAVSQIVDGKRLFAELTPRDMHWRMAKEFARMEVKFQKDDPEDGRTGWDFEDEFFNAMKDFRYIVPQGSPMFGVGNPFVNVSISNCFAGHEKFLTRTRGVRTLLEMVGRTTEVLTDKGWRKGEIRAFGVKPMVNVTVTPVMPSNGGGWRKFRSNMNRRVTVTPDHRWILADGQVTVALRVGDVVRANGYEAEEESANYRSGFTHGAVFGDGSQTCAKNGKFWFTMRLCGKKAGLLPLLDVDTVTYPPHAGGDPVVYVNSEEVDLKQYPFWAENADYLCGFIEGWLATDGMTTKEGTQSVSSQDADAIEWLADYAPFAGYVVTGHTIYTEPTNFGPRANPLHIVRLRETAEKPTAWRVTAIEDSGEAEAFCATVPDGAAFTLAGGIYTGNCVVVDSPEDSWGGIQKTATEIGNLFKRRAGVGIDISSLRPQGAKVNNAAITTSGAWSFAEHFSNVTKLIGQNGRRGALMITIDVRHPDVEAFAVMKRDKTKVNSANISILLSDEFMKAVEEDREWITRWPINAPVAEAKVVKTYRARELWHTINESAWLSAEPGLIFADNYKRNLPAHYYPGFEFLTVNPCSEIGLSAYDSCRLVSLNLKNFVTNPYTENAKFDFKLFEKMVRLATRMSDNVVELEIEYLTKIINKCDEGADKDLWTKLRQAAINGRRVGLGTHGLADMFLGLGVPYDSGEARVFAEAVFMMLRDTAYDESVNLAKERGAFPMWDSCEHTYGLQPDADCDFIQRLPKGLQEKMYKTGRRNISLLTMAPTGTVSLVSQTSSGIEPVFEFRHTRKKKIEAHDTYARVDEVDASGDKWQHFDVYHHAVREFLATNGSVTEQDLPAYFVSASQIHPMKRIELQGIIQRYIDHGISSTINLPSSASIDLIESIYMDAWKKGLKGVTVYRDGCRSGVLVTDATGNPEKITETRAPKRPKSLPCAIHRVKLSTRNSDTPEDWTFLVGMLDGAPYEIFGGPSEAVELPKKTTTGRIVKRKCDGNKSKSGRANCYDLVIGEGDDELRIRDIAGQFSPDDEDYGLITRMVSQELRHGVPLVHIVDQLSRSEKAALNSFSKVMARVLKKFIKEGAKSGENCIECGSKLVFAEGCQKCLQCGASKCS